MATQQLRINPETKQVEVLTPEGIWSSQAVEQQMAGMKSQVEAMTTAIPSIISGESIKPTVETPFKSPEETPISPPPEIPTAPVYEVTPKEKNISDIIAELTATSGLAGEKEAYRVEQEKALGIETLKTSEADYTAQLTQLKADYANIENRMQLAAEGRGITAGGLQPLTMAEQRKISIQANTVSALLAATQGKITFAQSQADRAVNAQYAQREADRKAKLENLDLLLKDPTLTVEQQNRANAQKAALDKQEKADTKKKEDSKTIMDWATKAAANGATPEQAQAIAKIALSDNPDLQAAFELYSPFSAKPEKDELLSVAEAKSLNVPYGTTRNQAIAMGKIPGEEGVETNVYAWFDELINLNPEATYEELITEFRNQQGEALSDSELKNYLINRGKKTAVEITEETKRTKTDTELRDQIEDGYKTEGNTKEDLIVLIQKGENTSKADKDRALELIEEMIPNEMNDWLKKIKSDPKKYEIRDDGIYEDRGFWTLSPVRWKKVYSF